MLIQNLVENQGIDLVQIEKTQPVDDAVHDAGDVEVRSPVTEMTDNLGFQHHATEVRETHRTSRTRDKPPLPTPP